MGKYYDKCSFVQVNMYPVKFIVDMTVEFVGAGYKIVPYHVYR